MLPHVAALDVALVTHAALPDGWVDDHLLATALAARGVSVGFVCWDDPTVQWPTVGVAAIRSTWDYHHRLDAFLAWAAHVASTTMLVNDAPIIEWNAHKSYLLDLARAGVPVVPTTLVPRGERHQLGRGRWVVKPAVSIGADRTNRDATQDDLDALVAETDVLVQPYRDAIERSGELSIMCIAGTPTHAVQKVPAAGDWRSQEHHGAAVTPVPVTDAMADLARAALAVAPVPPVYARVDVVEGEVMEVELIEPTLWFEHSATTTAALADQLATAAGR